MIFGGEPKYVGVPKWLDFQIAANFIHLSGVRLFIIIFAIVIGVITWFLLYRTTMGIRVRAVMQDKEMAASVWESMQIKFTASRFAYGDGVGWRMAGALFGALKTLFPDMGSGYIVEAFLGRSCRRYLAWSAVCLAQAFLEN